MWHSPHRFGRSARMPAAKQALRWTDSSVAQSVLIRDGSRPVSHWFDQAAARIDARAQLPDCDRYAMGFDRGMTTLPRTAFAQADVQLSPRSVQRRQKQILENHSACEIRATRSSFSFRSDSGKRYRQAAACDQTNPKKSPANIHHPVIRPT